MDITLHEITLPLLLAYDRDFQYDPVLFPDGQCPVFHFDPTATKIRCWTYQQAQNRKYFLILMNGRPVGEAYLKHIDPIAGQAELAIHLQNDSVKNQGIGTAAEKLLLDYAFQELSLRAVLADVLVQNPRSQRVLEKVGFVFLRQEGDFLYYRIDRENWPRPTLDHP